MSSAWGQAWGKSCVNSWGRLDESYLQFPEVTAGVDVFERVLEARTRWIKSERRRLGLLPPEGRETFLRKVEKQSIQLTPTEWKNVWDQQEQVANLLAKTLEQRLSYEVLLRLDQLQAELLARQILEERDIMFLIAVLSEL